MDIAAFYAALARGDADEVRRRLDEHPWLIDVRNPDTSDRAWDERQPLHCAAKRGHLPVVRLLVERGAEVYSNPMCSYPAVTVAAWEKHSAVVDYFLNEIPEKAEGTNKLGVMINLAARLGWTELVRKHIAADPLAVHQRGWIGDTPLHWPAHNNHVGIVGMLLDAGADIEAEEINCYGGTPLHWAAEHAPQAVQLLLERGAKVDSRNRKADTKFHGMTPLIMNATQKDDCAEVTELLLGAGAEVNARDATGLTALAHARQRGLKRIIAVLERKGAVL